LSATPLLLPMDWKIVYFPRVHKVPIELHFRSR
jgi:hypothetical protein